MRAQFYSVADMDFRHASYWRDQVAVTEQELERHVTATARPQNARWAFLTLRRNATCAAYTRASKLTIRAIPMPEDHVD
jgi:hypothetical protein